MRGKKINAEPRKDEIREKEIERKKRKREEEFALTAEEHQRTLPTNVARFPKCRRVVAALQNLALKHVRVARAPYGSRSEGCRETRL